MSKAFLDYKFFIDTEDFTRTSEFESMLSKALQSVGFEAERIPSNGGNLFQIKKIETIEAPEVKEAKKPKKQVEEKKKEIPKTKPKPPKIKTFQLSPEMKLKRAAEEKRKKDKENANKLREHLRSLARRFS